MEYYRYGTFNIILCRILNIWSTECGYMVSKIVLIYSTFYLAFIPRFILLSSADWNSIQQYFHGNMGLEYWINGKWLECESFSQQVKFVSLVWLRLSIFEIICNNRKIRKTRYLDKTKIKKILWLREHTTFNTFYYILETFVHK